MKALRFLGSSRLEIQDYPDPEPGPGQVVIKMKAAGICGSDLHFFKPETVPPYVAGHEAAGVVHELGEGVRDLAVGDRVGAYHYHGCGECRFCRSGYYMQCDQRKGYNWHIDGCDSDYLLTDERYIMPLPDGLNFQDGAIIGCAGGTAYSAVKKMDLSGRTSFVLFGAGPVGLAILMVAGVYGVRPIVADVIGERLEMAKRFGAVHLVNAAETDAVAEVMRLTGGKGADRIIIASGSSRAQADAIRCVAAGARVGFVGMRPHENTIDMDHFIRRQVTAVGSYVFPLCDYPEMAEFLIENNIHYSDMVSRTFKLEEAEEAYRLFTSGSAGKLMFVWDD